MEVIKRDGQTVEKFNKNKIYNAIMKAMRHGSGIIKPEIAKEIADTIEDTFVKSKERLSVPEIEMLVFQQLVMKGQVLTAKSYEAYRAVQAFKKNYTELDRNIEGIVDGKNKDAIEENSNKNAYIASTQRDLIAGEYSRDYTRRNLLSENIMYAHDEGIIHFHDSDYFLEHIINCCLVNLKDMLNCGTVINRKMIESPKSFRVACTVATQIVQQVANGQYGGQTISVAHLAPFLRVSYEKIKNKTINKWNRKGFKYTEKDLEESIMEDLHDELRDGVQTIQYQINTFSTCNGQAPFLSIFMYISEEPEYEKETAMIIEEMLRQRIQGLKNEVGVYVTPSFPKLLYVTDENNIYPDSKYFYLTRLAAECTAKRMVPDYISAKIMREQYDGEVFPCMGCRSFLTPWKDKDGKYQWYGRFNQGVCTLNLVDVALSAEHNLDTFWQVLDNRLQLCYDALMIRHNRLKNTPTSVSPIHWKYGALSRLGDAENFNELLLNGYSTISLGYAGLYECVYALIGESHTTKAGKELALMIMKHLKSTCDRWKDETSIAFSLYGTPLESTTYKLARQLKKRFGVISNVTDHDYVTNSYHVNVREEISAEDKLMFEAEFQPLSSGGCISYIETCNLSQNIDIVVQQIQFMYEHVRYAEMNGKFDYCQACGYEGELLIDEKNEWYCPCCGNSDTGKMNVARRTCGYIGDNFWNFGRTAEIKDRYVHIDNKDYEL